nr:hypothetical protein [Tanacetum cinerariifolium]
MNQNFFEPNPCYEPNSSSFDQYQPLQSFVTQQLRQRSNEDIQLEMAKLIKNNRIHLNNNTFSHEETSMEVLLAKERILKLIQAWDKKQIESLNFPGLLPQFLNDSRTIEQEANLAVQQEQEEHADDEEMLQSREKFMKDIQTFLRKFSRYPFGVMPKELAEYNNSPSGNSPTFYNDDEECFIQYKEYLEKYSNTITTVVPTKEPEYSLSMGDKHLSTTLETESDEVIKSSVKNLVLIPSEYEVTSDDESEREVPIKDESSTVFTTFSNPIFDDNDNFTSSVDVSLSDEEVPMEEFKVYSNPLFDEDGINSDKINPHCFNAESDFVESLSNHEIFIDSSPKFDYLKEFSGALMPTSIIDEVCIKRQHEEYVSLMEKLLSINSFPRPLENFQANMIVESLPTSPILIEDSDSPREEIDIFTSTDDLMPPGIESDDYDSEGDIHFLEELLVNDLISFPDNESSNFDHQDDPSFPRPLSEPPDVEIFFKPDSGVLTTNVVKGISEHYVLMPNILPTLPTFDPFYPVYDTLLPFSSENKDKVFKPGILSYLLVSYQDKITSDFYENPMIVYGGDIPLLDVQYLHFYLP